MEGQTLSHYKVLEKLGGGGMGVVYKALDTHLDRHVALKLLPPELTRDDNARERFVLEAKAASALDHPNICTIYDIDETPDGQMFIAMGYYDGETLKKRITRGPLPVEEALDIAIQMAQGLAEAHASDIVHRDIKPANVMLTKNGLVKIVDFGIAKLLGVTGPTQTGSTLGTVAYMSPEQLAGKETDQRTDVWSLGAVLYEMLTGQQPFTGDNEWAVIGAVSGREPTRPRSLRAEIPVDVEAVVVRALDKSRRKRYPTADELARQARACHEVLTRPAATATVRVSPKSKLLRPRIVLPAVLVLVLLGVGFSQLLTRSANERWAREEAIPEIVRLIEQDDYAPAFALAEQAERIVPDDRILADLWPQLSRTRSLDTTPTGAEVYFKPYRQPEDDWIQLGVTPLQDVRLPLGLLRVRIEKQGFEAIEYAADTGWEGNYGWSSRQLVATGHVMPGMVPIPSQRVGLQVNGFNPQQFSQLASYQIDKYEVTNEQFEEFIASEGYQQPEYWKREFVKDGEIISWQDAMLEFRDTTGRSGTSTWEGGRYPGGQDEYPVTGVSWYEAAAYAEYAGKSLPTANHWIGAASTNMATPIIALSNFGGEGPAAVRTHAGMSQFGTYDMAGNVKEWIWNRVGDGDGRYIMGGTGGSQRISSSR